MKITIKDLAKELGVSVGAVSTALNDKPGISLKLKEKIRSKAKEMGYYPNQAARNLVQNKTNKIAFFILSRGPIEIKQRDTVLFNYFLDEAKKNQKNLLVYSGDLESSKKNDYIRICREENVMGAVFIGLSLDDPSIEDLKEVNDFPIVIFDTVIGGNANAVVTDNKIGVNSALSYLYNIGHRKIALIKGHEKAQITFERYKVAENFLKEKNIFYKNLVFNGDFTRKSGYKIGKQMLENLEFPTAIFSFSDMMAIGAMSLLQEKGMSFPTDISIVGFDDSPLSEFLNLTTVAHDHEKISKEIINIILKKKKSEVVYVDPHLIIRKSCKKVTS